jgi:N-acetylated-alpha-linked acidic dipeptidase
MELARALGQLKQQGWRPRRTILLASWDAEEFCLGSSTEWAEEHADILGRSAVAYINVDTAATGPELAATAVPALNRVIVEAARVVRDPAWRVPLTAAARQRASRARGASTERADAELVQNLVGGGSDYTVFLNHLGIPIADIGFRGPHGVYHSAYDTHAWVARFGDPGFRYHAALVQLWGVIAMRLAGADIVPLDYGPYADAVSGWIAGIERRLPADSTESLRTAAAELKSAAERLNRVRDDALEAADSLAIARVNGTLLAVERALLDPEGLPGRPWYRHQIYAPAFSYAPQVLPGPTGALDQGAESGEVLEAIDRLAAALRRAAATLSGPGKRRDNGSAGSAARNTLK